MNYRHAFHAGNHADCLKHVLLVWLLGALARKPAPFAVLDTHAGRGIYDLGATEAQRTGEAAKGALRLADVRDGPLAPYVDALRAQGFPARYPGSPSLIRGVLRDHDRLACCELHPEDHAALRTLFARDRQVAVHRRDAWEAIRALTPFPERRGLVLLDPPFEKEDEFARLAAAITEVNRRFRAAIVAAWYPVKHRAPVRDFHDALRASAVRDVVAAELWLREPTDPRRLNGSGLLVVNPPFGFEEAAGDMLAALLAALETEAGAGVSVQRVTPE
ncbi:23S rRNA (adenine(2030)-N(6))-methyltransferase RlmJ [Roseomonas sp. PWR1]|uniref:Ribosomal RNA large subunit methyltransferase J n=1 Tax=Roseomonas nitratireducens TaxID=2820810 RepID=A0ABS4ALP9_9PROT|nr:23S rRNA (adenine(2030)-N(6))-methyltransferase RlmJ [Neoroseomonas nitratireducens]MBP0462285.1 23S rRNA (adenine(2030)-N(6))-methyltransferase RlmJ [Neoroseomonas nitratireducens]